MAKTPSNGHKDEVEDDGPKIKKAKSHRVSDTVSKLIALRDSPSGLMDRDAVLALVVDAVVEIGGGGAADAGSATEIEKVG